MKLLLALSLLASAAVAAPLLEPERTAMPILTAWGAANLLGGAGLALAATNATLKSFGGMSAGWGAVNLTIAIIALASGPSASSHASQATVYAVNGGLDLLYIGGGIAMLVAGTKEGQRKEMWTGFGRSLLLQGAFLLVFDAVLAGIHHFAGTGGAGAGMPGVSAAAPMVTFRF